MNYLNNLMGTVESKVKDIAKDMAVNAALQEEIQRINVAKTKTVNVDRIAETDERPFETMEISPEEQREYDIKSYQAEQRILEEAAEQGLPPPTFGRPTPVPGEEPSNAEPIAAFGKRKINKIAKKLKKIVKKRRKKKTVKKRKKKKTVKKRRKKKTFNLKKVAKKTVKDVTKHFNKIKEDIQDIVKIGKKKRSFGRSATLPPMTEGVYNAKGYDPHALLMQSFFGKKRKFGKNSDCKTNHKHFENVSPRDPMYKPQKKLSYGKRKRKRRVKKRKSKRKVKKRKSKRKVKKRKFGKKVSKKPSATLRRLCKKYRVRLTIKRNGKRFYKSEKVLKKQCKNAMKRKK